jgi:ribose-phosphate pyrophosphokinase
MGCQIAIIDKRRPRANVAEVMGLVGDVAGKTAIIIDDMIDTAGSITQAAQALIDAGAVEVYAACTHPLLSGPAIERIKNSVLKEVICMNTIKLPAHKQIDKIIQLNVGQILAQGVINIIQDRPLSRLFEYQDHKNTEK